MEAAETEAEARALWSELEELVKEAPLPEHRGGGGAKSSRGKESSRGGAAEKKKADHVEFPILAVGDLRVILDWLSTRGGAMEDSSSRGAAG